jgi:hypothetical protein
MLSQVMDPRADRFGAGIKALTEGAWDQAEAAFQQGIVEGDRRYEIPFFLGVLAYLRGQSDQAVATIKQVNNTGLKVSDEFSRIFGQVVQGLGQPVGEDLRKFLQRHRLLPPIIAGKLGVDLSLGDIEPWYFSRRATNLFPRKNEEFQDPARIIEKYILPGWLPDQPLFKRNSALLTMGSCFAQELRNYLAEQGMASGWMFVPPGLNNTFAIRNFIDWCLTGRQSEEAYWYDEKDGGAIKWDPEQESQAYRRVFEKIHGLVLTIGLAEVWYDIETAGVFWRGVPKSIYDEEKHRCRMSTVEENINNISHVVRSLKAARPELPIIITLSPIALKATFEPKSCFTAD